MRFLVGSVLCLGLVFQNELAAQSKLSVCAGIDGEGNCYLSNSKFITSPGKEDGVFFLMVNNAGGLNTNAIDFRISSVNNKGEEILMRSVRQEIGADWIFAWKSELFNSPGIYSVSIFDANGLQLDKKMFELFRFQ
jgi:hypothetical protein